MGEYSSFIRFGYGRSDLTLLYANPDIFKQAVLDMVAPFQERGITKVMALEAQGFALGALAAFYLRAGLVHVRKENKIAWDTLSVQVTDYSKTVKTLTCAQDVLSKKDRILIIDDWSETGAQLKGAIALAEKAGAQVIGAAAIHIDEAVLRDSGLSGYLLHSLEDGG